MNSEFNYNCPMLPPKLSESERMNHVQHWVNTLPMELDTSSYAPSAPDSSSDSCRHTTVCNNNNAANNMIYNGDYTNNINTKPLPTNRLFSESETEILVELFKDYFMNGLCPTTDEVRRRTMSTDLALNRNPTSLRGKVKRMIANRKWVGYIRH